MKIGVLIAMDAAGGANSLQAARLGHLLRNEYVYAVAGWGAEALEVESLPCMRTTSGYLDSLRSAVDAFLSIEPDVYILMGGDGLASYVAERLLVNGCSNPKLIGIKGGTANAGPIISLTLEEFSMMTISNLEFEPCDVLLAYIDNRQLALGFNDLVLGNTLLSTIDGQKLTISARTLAIEGRKEVIRPMDRIADNLYVMKNGQYVPFGLLAPAQAVLSSLDRDRTYGRAVLGALCSAAGNRHVAALSLISSPVVSFEKLSQGESEFMSVSQLLFREGDELVLSGLIGETCLIADGNPYLLPDGCLKVRVIKDAVQVIRRSI